MEGVDGGIISDTGLKRPHKLSHLNPTENQRNYLKTIIYADFASNLSKQLQTG